jgi:hypothetical protein
VTGWHDFLVAEVGAAATLAGLLFVAISINVTRIIAFPGLPERAAQGLIILMGVLLEASCGLIPQRADVWGWELVVIGGTVWYLNAVSLRRGVTLPEFALQRRINVGVTQLATLPCVVAGFAMLAGSDWALIALAAGFLLSLATAVFNAWVLMVEILR